MTAWAPAASSATCWNAARRRQGARLPTGTPCPTGTISATRSPSATDDGSFVVSKPDGTGGPDHSGRHCRAGAVRDRPTPPPICCPTWRRIFSNVRAHPGRPGHGACRRRRGGRPPTSTYKVSATYQDGYRAVATVSIVGIDAARKAERNGRSHDRTRSHVIRQTRACRIFVATHIEALGAEASYGTTSAAPRIAGGVASARGATSQPRGAGHLRARNRLGRAELRARHDRHLFRGVPSRPRVVRLFHLLPRKKARSADRECRSATRRRPRSRYRSTVASCRPSRTASARLRAIPAGPYRQFAAVASRLCAFRRQGQFLERRDHRPQARIRAAAAPRGDAGTLGRPTRPSRRWPRRAVRGAWPPRAQFSDRRCTGRRGEWPPSGSTRKARRTARWRWR